MCGGYHSCTEAGASQLGPTRHWRRPCVAALGHMSPQLLVRKCAGPRVTAAAHAVLTGPCVTAAAHAEVRGPMRDHAPQLGPMCHCTGPCIITAAACVSLQRTMRHNWGPVCHCTGPCIVTAVARVSVQQTMRRCQSPCDTAEAHAAHQEPMRHCRGPCGTSGAHATL
eukprot:364058-Chlamydomonas_euryale.AAC.4